MIPVKMLTVEEIENTTFKKDTLKSGELCAWKWTDLNFETNISRITKTLYNPDNNMRNELTPPKTTASICDFDLDESVMNLILNHKKNQTTSKPMNKTLFTDYHDKNFVFAHDNGYPFIQKIY
ncbi:hypothetical protein PGLA_02325 [Paenibacillus glacialis]|uniref:Uncharacterized protein n=2 Tax=Paenibacillus glacialis TaxID=494026 RepID=A0A168NZ58_9BACL|nr:hypothetical protein PGLA_02325 [Paenibacillus glacialis]